MRTEQLNRNAHSMYLALKAIADTKTNENTDHKQLTALFIAMAKTEIEKIEKGDTKRNK
jgi:hypothetical protein